MAAAADHRADLGWGLRLAWHIGRRNHGKPEDPRYVAIMERAKGNPVLHLVRKVYIPQA